ncbi:MAG: DNA translocase FtsK [Fibrobacterota bacterium]|nr:DNA translocase FtsK [Fibrobacterota bacterium]
MKTAKRKAKKPSPRSKGKEEPEAAQAGGHSLVREAWGLMLLSVSLVTVIALLSGFANPGKTNILGPYLGDWWADTLNQFAGSLPILFLVAAVATLGFKMVLAKGGGLRIRIVLALTLLFVCTGILLSIKNIAKTDFIPLDYMLSGGYLGNFIVQKFFLPVFGASQFGPYLISAIGTLFVVIWGFRMSVVQVSEKSAESIVLVGRPFFLQLRRLWSPPEGAEAEDGYGDAEDPRIAAAEIAKARKDAKDERGRLALAKFPLPEVLNEPKQDGRRKRGSTGKDEAGADRYVTNNSMDKPPVLSSNSFLGDQGGTAEDEAEDLDEIDMSDPLAVRKLRDLGLERKRVSELNDWEIKARDPEIAGMLQKEKAKELARLESIHEAAQVAPAADALANKGEEDKQAPVSLRRNVLKVDDEDADTAADSDEAATDGVGDIPVKAVRAPMPKPPKPEVKYDVYRVPSHDDIFTEPPKQPLEFTEEELREQSKVLEDQLINFKVMGKVTQICPGPVITRYEVELAPGVKVSRISTLADDLALALRAKSIRILAPIPGKSVVGIEVPNRKAQIVYIKEILRSPEFALEEDSLKICLGKTIAGEPYVMDLTRAPHLLIAGQTGSGKSVCINSIMASFLCSKSPDVLRMILVDPKVVELKPYDAIPHLLYPVITQPDVAVQALKWATFEMDRRYEVLAQCGVRNIKGFNAKVREGKLPDTMEDEDKKILPYIVIVIDELADLMMVAGKEVETNIARIAQKARAVGIHLILATQRPSTNVITGTIKANLPTRIAFQVASQIDARTIMDKMGAEKLLGRGDMLFRPIEFPEPVRLHGCFLDDAQAERLALVASEQHVNYPQIQSFNLEDDPSGESGKVEPRDEKFREAAELVVQVKQASVSLLQRRLGIGYARSGRLVDQMERAGVVGRERGSKPREVLMNPEELQSFLSSGLNDD